ncbi:hypothetical protein RB653_003245 [Dictyostelium firmibasis]|uniref:Profilin n=1 Tax=Dictyostelium firmibasis TaxID=79012 RepID=A0AAN7TRU5_9MYCE
MLSKEEEEGVKARFENYIKKIINGSFLKGGIIDIDTGDLLCSSKDFNVCYVEYQEILNILNGSALIGFLLNGDRYYVTTSDDIRIHGKTALKSSGSTSTINGLQSVIIRRTKEKCVIGVFNENLTQESAEKTIEEIIDDITKLNKNENISNLIEE